MAFAYVVLLSGAVVGSIFAQALPSVVMHDTSNSSVNTPPGSTVNAPGHTP